MYNNVNNNGHGFDVDYGWHIVDGRILIAPVSVSIKLFDLTILRTSVFVAALAQALS